MSATNQLGSFLRARRERADPTAAGIVDSSRRRVPGLRREELALLAGLSASYYARLEQGRDRHPSPEVLGALARVLRLDDAERAYLNALAVPQLERASPAGSPTGVRAGVLHLLDRWSDLPAFVVNPRRDVLAATPFAARLNPAWTTGINLVEFTFLDPRARAVYPDWDDIAAQAVAGLRASSVTGAAEVADLVARLRNDSESFRSLWDAHEVYDRVVGDKRLGVEGVGTVRLSFETFAVTGPELQVLFVYFPEPGSDDEHLLDQLA